MPLLLAKGSTGEQSKGVRTDMAKDELLLLRKELQEDASNDLEEMMYPKVQKFVLISVANSLMDFHLSFGGTSMWFYVFRGHSARSSGWRHPRTRT